MSRADAGALELRIDFHQPQYDAESGILDQLPVELKLIVFSRLDAFELGALCCTSHEMRRQTEGLWAALYERRWAGTRVSSCNLFSPIDASADCGAGWRLRYGRMEAAERALQRGHAKGGVELEGSLGRERERGRLLQSDIALSATLACVVASGSAHNTVTVWAGHVAPSSVDVVRLWRLPSGRALSPIELLADPTGMSAPVVRVSATTLYLAAARSHEVVVYACDGCSPSRAHALSGHGGEIKSISVHDGLIASGSADGTARIWNRGGGPAKRVIAHPGPVVEVQLLGARLVTQYLHVGGAGGSSTTLWDAHAGARLAVWDGWACLGPQAAHICVQGEVRLSMYDTQSVRLAHVLRHPGQEAVCCGALASSAEYVLSAIAPADEDAPDDGHGWYVAAWRVRDGQLLGLLGPHPWEVETVALLGHVAVCLAYDSPPPQIFAWDLSKMPGELAPPNQISYPSSLLAFSIFGPQMVVALSDGCVVATNLAASARQRSGSSGSNVDADRALPSPTILPTATVPPPLSDDFERVQMLE